MIPAISLTDALAQLDLAATLKDSGRHPNYARTVQLASEYTALATGQNFEQFLVMFNRREDPAQFTQRTTITVPKTSSLLYPAITQFQRTSRLQNIRRDLTYDNKPDNALLTKIRDSIGSFYGEGGTDEWIATIYDWVSLIDPNSYAVVEFDKDEKGIYPYPVVYFAPMVYQTGRNHRKQLQYLLVEPSPGLKGAEYLLYGGAFTLRYTRLPDKEEDRPAVINSASNKYAGPEGDVFQPINGDGKPQGAPYLRQYYPTKCPFVQAERMGYLPDPVTQFDTCVSALEPAKFVLIDHVRTGSNFDLSKYMHVMPQKVVVVPKCNHCNGGTMPDGSTCPTCKGTGKQPVHTQPTDTIEVPQPQHLEDLPDLSKLIQYVQVELGTLDALDKNLDKLANAVYVAIFNNQSIQQTAVTPINTATEFAARRDNENNTLAPFVAHKASIYRFAVRCQAVFVSDATFDIDKLGVVYEPPKDLVVMTQQELYAYLLAAVTAGMPPLVLEKIVRQSLEMDYEGDEEGLQQLRIRLSIIPFVGLPWDQLIYLDANGYIKKRDMVLYAYQDSVFEDLLAKNETFYALKQDERNKLVDDYVNQIIADLPKPDLSNVRMGNVKPMPITPVNEQQPIAV